MAKRRIVIEVDVPDGSEMETFDEADDAAFEVAQQAYQQALVQLAEAREDSISVTCPRCGSSDVVRKGFGERKLYARMGGVQLRPRRLQCRACGRTFSPSVDAMGSS
jgi:transposase-like protein